jgi:hypothetical protein
MLEEIKAIEGRARICAVDCVARMSEEEDINPAVFSSVVIGMVLGSSAATAKDLLGTEGLVDWATVMFEVASKTLERLGVKSRFSFEIRDANPAS